MGNCVCQQTSRDTQADQSFDNSSTCHRDLDSGGVGVVCRTQNVRRNRNSSNIEDGTRSDNGDDQILFEDSASIHDGIDTHIESSNELHLPSERVMSPLIERQISFNSLESLHVEPRLEEESNRENLSNDSSFVSHVTTLSRYRLSYLDSYDRQHERIAHTNDNSAVDNDIQQSINESFETIFEGVMAGDYDNSVVDNDIQQSINESNEVILVGVMAGDYDFDLVGDSDDDIDDVDIMFVEDNSAGSSDKRIYFDGNSCGICVSEYDEESRKRVTLPCGHVLCSHCVRKIAKRKHYLIMECPMDRIKHSITVKIAGKTIPARSGENGYIFTDRELYVPFVDYLYNSVN